VILADASWGNRRYNDKSPPTTANNTPLAERRNPTGSFEEVAMDAYRNNANPVLYLSFEDHKSLLEGEASSQLYF
jgi:hypothetical protein